MTITAKDDYKTAIDQVYQLLTDQTFLQKKYEAVGSRKLIFQECEQKEEVFRIRWTREVQTDPPAFVKAFVEPWNKLTEVMEWREHEGVKEGTYKGKIADLSATIRGKFRLMPTAEGCVEHIEMEAESAIPFVGSKIAELIEKDTLKNLQGEYQFTRDYLGEV